MAWFPHLSGVCMHSFKHTAQNSVASAFFALKQPILMLLGSDDKIIVHEVTEEMFKESTTEGNKLVVYQGMYHELINDLDKETVFKEMSQWIASHQ